ncbi:hypothetical protein F183_A04350 [Bryobacterales bacterium F-183]|nr:hypothetical protein F183_A04350 [Bryobacterales bacterium F-183]
MLVFRQSQMNTLAAGLRAHYEEELARHFLDTYPRECRQAGGPAQIHKLVVAGIERANQRGFQSQSEVSMYISLQFILGASFDTDPQLPWAKKTLEDRRIASPELRLRCVFGETIDYLTAIAGDKSQHIVRALIRLRDGDLSTVPPVDDRWTDNMLDLLRKLYPQKFDHQGVEANTLLLNDALGKCDFFLNLKTAQGKGLIAILMFMLGSGFENDHLHPWTSRILMDPRFATEEERVSALHQAAKKHIAESLTSDFPTQQ